MSTPPEHAEPSGHRRQSPIGLAFDPGSTIPRVIEAIAEVAERRVSCVIEQARSMLGGLGVVPAREAQLQVSLHDALRPPAARDVPTTADAAGVEHEQELERDAEGARATSEAIELPGDAAEPGGSDTAGGAPADVAPAADDLAIPAYDSLSASQVVPRLPSLQPEDLELIRRYESAGRGRRTILNRVAQLQGA